jgi:hypothetical protein
MVEIFRHYPVLLALSQWLSNPYTANAFGDVYQRSVGFAIDSAW